MTDEREVDELKDEKKKSDYLEISCVVQDSKGKFKSKYKEKRGNAIALRLPESVDQATRTAAGWNSPADNPKLKHWIEDAIAEKLKKLEREITLQKAG